MSIKREDIDQRKSISRMSDPGVGCLRFIPVSIQNGQAVDLGDVGVSRWFGWLDGTTYLDRNGNGKYDEGTDTPLANTAMTTASVVARCIACTPKGLTSLARNGLVQVKDHSRHRRPCRHGRLVRQGVLDTAAAEVHAHRKLRVLGQ